MKTSANLLTFIWSAMTEKKLNKNCTSYLLNNAIQKYTMIKESYKN